MIKVKYALHLLSNPFYSSGKLSRKERIEERDLENKLAVTSKENESIFLSYPLKSA